ncbi:MAG TPA: hypothetical protein VF756_07490 [Thermoanaerobaculia bacterium]
MHPRKLLVTGWILIVLTLISLAASAQGGPSAEKVAGQVMQALGGKEAWDATRFLRFTFAGRRTHHWDKWTGRHRIEGQTQEGQRYLVLHNINTRQGDAWLDGQKLDGDKAKEWLERAYQAWVNDTYWLLMPYKLRDPGVKLTHEGTEQIDGKTYDKLHLTFESVGLTPKDRYWAYINRDTHLMDRWAYVLQDQPADAQPTVWAWQGWQRYGKIMLAPSRSQVTGDRKLELGDIAVFDSLPDSVFTSPEPVAK